MEIELKKEITRKFDITKEEFKSYVDCQKSGVTNMFNLSNVQLYTGLEKDKLKAIMKHYEELEKEFN